MPYSGFDINYDTQNIIWSVSGYINIPKNPNTLCIKHMRFIISLFFCHYPVNIVNYLCSTWEIRYLKGIRASRYTFSDFQYYDKLFRIMLKRQMCHLTWIIKDYE